MSTTWRLFSSIIMMVIIISGLISDMSNCQFPHFLLSAHRHYRHHDYYMLFYFNSVHSIEHCRFIYICICRCVHCSYFGGNIDGRHPLFFVLFFLYEKRPYTHTVIATDRRVYVYDKIIRYGVWWQRAFRSPSPSSSSFFIPRMNWNEMISCYHVSGTHI